MKKKNDDLKYKKYSIDFESTERWNVCQKLASAIYKSELTIKEIKEGITIFKNK